MAFIIPDEEDNLQNTNTNQVLKKPEEQPGSNPTTGGGGTGSAAAPSGAANGTQQTGFAGIMDYLGANKDQAGGMTDQIVTNLGKQYGDTKSTIDTAVGNANKDVSGATINYDPDFVSGALKDPSSFVQDPNNLSKFSGMRDASYQGPGSFEDSQYYGDVAKAATKASDTYTAAKSTPGYTGLLSQVEQNPTAGRSALDAGILATDPTAQGRISSALEPFAGINDYLKSQSAGVNANIAGAKKADADTSSKTKQAVQDTVNQFNGDISSKVGKARTDAQASIDNLRNKLASGQQLTSQELAQLGITGENLTNLRNTSSLLKSDYNLDFDPTVYFDAKNPDVELRNENVASPEDFARESALQKLMGGDIATLNDSEANLAGTAPKSLASYEMDPAYSEARGALSNYDKQTLSKYPDSPGFQNNLGDKELRTVLDAYQRNPDQLSQSQKQWLSVMLGQVPGSPFTPPNPGVNTGGVNPPTSPVDQNAPPKDGESRTRVIENPDGSGGQEMWWNGSSWVQAPAEFTGMQNGQYTQRFNYNTGAYEPYSGTGGVFRAF